MSEPADQSTDTQRRGGFAVRLFLFAGLFAAAAAVLGGLAWRSIYAGEGPAETETIVLLAPGSSVAAMGRDLEEAGVIRSKDWFRRVARLTGAHRSLQAGEYAIPPNASLADVLRMLEQGEAVLHKLTAPEGLTTAQILRVLAEHPALEGEVTLTPAEGALLPETYYFARGAARDDIIREMMAAQDAVFAEIWNDRASALPFSTREEALTIASIVEKETALPEERPRIAAVFVNRLRRGMRMESDPTIIYGLTGGEPLGRGLRRSELDRETPYNTYKIRGLPPTPIANPGRAAIEAVLNPPQTDELYFVADGTGGHEFAKTYEQHRSNVARWRRIESQQRSGG